MTYAEKLRHPKWQKVRLKVFQRDDWACVKCLDDDSELHVHHLIYYPGDPWDTPMKYLQTLCHSCHLKEERKKKIKKIIYANRKLFKNNNRR